jgi:hypothetical protein
VSPKNTDPKVRGLFNTPFNKKGAAESPLPPKKTPEVIAAITKSVLPKTKEDGDRNQTESLRQRSIYRRASCVDFSILFFRLLSFYIIDLFSNPVGCLTSPAISQAKALRNCVFQRKLFNN